MQIKINMMPLKLHLSNILLENNVIFEKAQFNMRCQQEGESAEAFITAVHKLAEHCSFGALKDELIRDRIVVGIKTLSKAIQKVRQSETH